MATSRVEMIPKVIDAARECDAHYGVKTVLDVGCGAGLYGALLRQYFEHAHNRFDETERTVNIVGVEGHNGYENPNYGHYDELLFQEIEKFLDEDERRFDLVLALDVVEHLDLDAAGEVMRRLYQRTEKYLIISTPSFFREQWQPEKEWESELQEHRCLITPDFLESLFPRYRVEEAPGGLVWMAVVKKEYLTV